MKQKDIALIIVVAAISIVVGFVASGLLLGSSGKGKQTAETVDAISASFPAPDKRYFNEKSVDPTQTITIGDTSNNQPFQQSQ